MSAARIRIGSEASDSRNTAAAPWNFIVIADGGWSRWAASSIAVTASPSDTPAAVLNDSVTDGNCPSWAMSSGACRGSKRARFDSGTGSPFAPRT